MELNDNNRALAVSCAFKIRCDISDLIQRINELSECVHFTDREKYNLKCSIWNSLITERLDEYNYPFFINKINEEENKNGNQ